MIRLFKKKNYKPIVLNEIDPQYIKNFIYEWNMRFPVDRWWREKHKVAFNSSKHREMSFIDIKAEWEEDKLYNEVLANDYKPDTGNWIKEIEDTRTEEEKIQDAQQEWESIKKDLDKYTD